jgi:hypothetical protein
MALATASRHLVVAGDVVIDRHIYAGERYSLTARDRLGVREISERGGAHLLARSLNALLAADAKPSGSDTSPWAVHLGVEATPLDAASSGQDGYALWEPHKPRRDAADDTPRVWRASRLMGYGHLAPAVADGPSPPQMRPVPDPDLVVLDDAGFMFRHAAARPIGALAERLADKDGFILLKMSEPVAQGELWHMLATRFADRLVCLVAARDLRREKLGLGRGLSWEATLDDLRLALDTNPAATNLLGCQHLIVTFSSDGALWLERRDRNAPRARVCLDPARAEGEWAAQFEGEVIGFHCAMAAALAIGLAAHTDARRSDPKAVLDLLPTVEAGLLAMRDLAQYGHGVVGNELPTGYPAARIAGKILDSRGGKQDATERLARMEIAWPPKSGTPATDWSIVEASQQALGSAQRRSLIGLARQVALRGTGVLERLPHAQFGKLVTADRAEIEALRHIRLRMRVYEELQRPKRPLTIGVFGPPGAGKSFGVQQLAEDVFGKEAWREFNLSQFRDSTDLNGAFHQVRDLALSGRTPVVFWDEFDSRELLWLQYLLAPMQDGRFQDGQLNHAIGKCVFIFAGGTSWSFAEFSPRQDTPPTEAQREAMAVFRLRKGPDFASRLDAFMDVLGPNPRSLLDEAGERKVDPDDVGYPLRRALLIRAYLGCKPADRVDFDPDLLHALLRVSKYRHGARSLEKLMDLLRGADGLVVRRSNLPRPAQLEMHVDVSEFMDLMHGEAGELASADQSGALEVLAVGVHDTWRAQGHKECWPMQPKFDKPYAELAEIDKEDNRVGARRIPEVLALVGLGLHRDEKGAPAPVPDDELRAQLEQNIERLAEAEHDGWVEHRSRNGWRYAGTRDDAKKLHPDMVPYAKLPEREKGKDRNTIRHYPDSAARAGYRIVPIG